MKLQNMGVVHLDGTTASFASRLAAANGIPSIAERLMTSERSLAKFLKGDLE